MCEVEDVAAHLGVERLNQLRRFGFGGDVAWHLSANVFRGHRHKTKDVDRCDTIL